MAKAKKKESGNWLKFLGTAGARFVMIKQLRSSGGIWLSSEGTNVLIDPGPGSLVRCAASRPKLDPGKLDAIILTHRHLDHSNDINVMIEAMTEGGFKRRGKVYLPADALNEEGIVLRHVRNFPEEIIILKENSQYQINDIKFSVPCRQIHPGQTYGLKFNLGKVSVSFISDTLYFKEIKDCFRADIIIINTVFYEPRPGIDHLSLTDAINIIQEINPQKAVLTHFGMTMLKAKPHDIALKLSKELGIEVIAAYDGMSLELP